MIRVVLAVLFLGLAGCASLTYGPRMELPQQGFAASPGSVEVLSRRVEVRACQNPDGSVLEGCVYAPLQIAFGGAPVGPATAGECGEGGPLRKVELEFVLAEAEGERSTWIPFEEGPVLRTAALVPRFKDTGFKFGGATAVTPADQQGRAVIEKVKELKPEEKQLTRQIDSELRDVLRDLPPTANTVYRGHACAIADDERVVNVDLVLLDPTLSAGMSYQLWLWNPQAQLVAIHPQQIKVVNSIAWLSWLLGLSGVAAFLIIGGLL